jgi:hypothetical protein
LREMRNSLLHEKRRARIELLGDSHEIEEVMRKTTFEDVILPDEILEQVASQRRIFSQGTLARYARLGIPRLRKVLLIGPPETGKTSLRRAAAAPHLRRGGLVFYAFASHKEHRSWEQLAYALRQAVVSRLPTLILVEDFELFVSDAEDPSGCSTRWTAWRPRIIRWGRWCWPQTTHRRKSIRASWTGRAAYREEEHAPLAPTFLKQTDSHMRKVCLLGSIYALDQGQADISRGDLRWAHETLLHGRALAGSAARSLATRVSRAVSPAAQETRHQSMNSHHLGIPDTNTQRNQYAARHEPTAGTAAHPRPSLPPSLAAGVSPR